jgi:SPP1 gp7 family putative phage head morphogenesis protein
LLQLQQLPELYSHVCCEHTHALQNLIDDGEIENLIRQVFDANGSLNQSALRDVIFGDLWKGVREGLGIDYDTVDQSFLDALRNNVTTFSAAKDKAILVELNAALLNEAGALRTFAEFKDAALKITDQYLKNYLQTENNLAVTAAQMAAKWRKIVADASTLPLLQFDAVMDARTTEICRPLHGTTLPINHPFWKRFYPPNHFNCRSTVRQLPYGTVTPESKIPSADIPGMFQTNLGERTLIFPPDHPYFIRN